MGDRLRPPDNEQEVPRYREETCRVVNSDYTEESATGTFDLAPFGISKIDSSGGAVTATLGSGPYIGQRKTLVMTDASNSSTVSVTNHETSDPEIFTFAQVNDTLVLMWQGNQWITTANSGAAT